jgi:hypothetical protein
MDPDKRMRKRIKIFILALFYIKIILQSVPSQNGIQLEGKVGFHYI